MAHTALGLSPALEELISEANALVTELYDPANQRNPTKVKNIQARLQYLQKCDHAWEIADSLLQQHSAHHRFMGALTFTVKVNVSGAEIEEPLTRQILERLTNHFIFIVNEGEQAMVIRKLASSLVTIFRHSASTWTHAIWQLTASLANGSYVTEQEAQTVDLLKTLLPALTLQKATALVYFSVALAEEALRLGAEPQASVGPIIERVVANIKDAFLLVQYILPEISYSASVPETEHAHLNLGNEAISSWKTWLGVYGNHRHSIEKETLDLAMSCGRSIIEMLKLPNFSESSASILTAAIESRSWVFDNSSINDLSNIISDSIVTVHIMAIIKGDEGNESMPFIDLLVAYVSFVDFQIFTSPMMPQNAQILLILHNLLKTPGYAAIEDTATPRILEYWSGISESLNDHLEAADPRYQIVKEQLADVVMGLFSKLLYPTAEDLAEFGDDERSEFNSFRYDACDYLLAAYPILGIEMINVFQESASNNLANFDWRSFEAAMFCIAQLSEAVDENGHADQCLNSIFGSEAFSQLCRGGEIGMPLKARQTLVDTFGKYESYFKRHSFLLPGVLNILFESLNFESCAQSAARSILTLSKSAARVLVPELPVFLDWLDQFRNKPTATASTMPKVLEGIATIIQKLPSDQDKVHTLERILEFFVQEANRARAHAADSVFEVAQTHAHLVLSCIASVGRGLRVYSDEPINVDDTEGQVPYPLSFWNAGPGSRAQQLIMEAMQLLIVDFPLDSGIIDSACDILRAGYTESSGLFVFSPSLTVDFIKRFPLGIAGTNVIMATASSFLASHASHPMQIQEQATELIVHVSRLFGLMLENADSYDPETANAGIDFLARLLPKYYPILLSLTQPLPDSQQGTPIIVALLNFTIHALTRPEPLAIRSGSTFWVAMMDLRSNSPQETAALDHVLEQFIPTLCQTLIIQISGRCARSDLSFLNDVLRRTIFKKMALARPSLTTALNALNAQATDANGNQVPLLSPQEKSRFLESLIVARGAKSQSMEIVLSFWLKCRGMNFDYAQ